MKFENEQDTSLFDYYERPGEQFWATTYFRLNSDHTGHKHLTSEIGDLSLDFIEKYGNEGPFCLSVSFHAPHAEDVDPQQYIYPQDMDTLYQNEKIPDPILNTEDRFDEQPEWVKTGLNKVRWYWRFDTEEKYQRMVKGYYRMISGVDKELGRIREKLEQTGIADNTIIIFMGDNGYFLGERKLAGKWLMYDNSLRVPLIIYDPRQEEGRQITDLALNIDVAPTILSYAGIKIPAETQGKALDPLISNGKLEWRDSFLCEHLFENKRIPKSEGIRTDRWKYFRYVDHPEWEELYDLESDPNESNNLIKVKEVQPELEKLRGELGGILKKL